MSVDSVSFQFGFAVTGALGQAITNELNGWQGTTFTLEEACRKASSEDVAGALARLQNVPVLRRPTTVADPELSKSLDGNFLRKCLGFPVALAENILTVALVNPFDTLLLQRCQEVWSGVTIQVAVTPYDDIITWIQSGGLSEAEQVDLSTIEVSEEIDTDRTLLLDVPDEDPLKEKLRQLFLIAVRNNASDLHFVLEKEHFYVEWRIDGVISREERIEERIASKLDALLMRLAGEKTENKRSPQDGRLTLKTGSSTIAVRYARAPLVNRGFHVTCRLLDSAKVPRGIFDGGVELGPFGREWLQRMLAAPEGMLLISGPTGSGKSTTLYSILREINKPIYNIVTVENPVEMVIKGVKQCQINPDIPDDFANYLKSGLRRDPDIFLVGEIRDKESAELAVQAANTGHLVFSTIHTKTAAGIFTRLEDFGLPRWKIADSLIGAAAQRLPRALCPHCKQEKHGATDQECLLYGLDPSWREKTIYVASPNGCSECRHTGYRGRRACLEIIPVTEELADFASKPNVSSRDIAKFAYENLQVSSLRSLGLSLVENGVTDFNAVAEVINITMS